MFRIAATLSVMLAVGAGAVAAEDESLELLWESLPETGLVQRLDEASKALVGVRYALSPLGEAQEPDLDPRFRLDAFDCTTYIETVLALALAASPEEVLPRLDELRYQDGRVEYSSRHHLPESQWMPALQSKGLLLDVTRKVGGEKARSLTLHLDTERWQRRQRARDLILPAGRVPDGDFEVPYLPIAHAVKLLDDTEDALVVNVVRELEDGSPIVITHQALVFPGIDGAGARVRHASSVHGRVLEVSLSRFVAGQAMARRWPVVGLNVQRWLRPVD